MDPRTRIVREGYDALRDRYVEWAGRIEDDPRERFLGEFRRSLSQGARILDLGCGATPPTWKGPRVVGVDLSTRLLQQGRKIAPEAALVQADMAEIAFRERSFDGVVALFSISHVPRERHAALFARIASWLRPGGLFLASLSAGDDPGWTGEWLGVRMFFNGFDADTNRGLLRAAGFEMLLDEVITEREPEGEVTFLWVLAAPQRG